MFTQYHLDRLESQISGCVPFEIALQAPKLASS